jgi:hypothetical protein
MTELAEGACDSRFCVALRQVMGAMTSGAADRFVEDWNAAARECGLTSSDRTSVGDVARPGPSTFFAREGYPHLRVSFNITPGSAQRRVTLLVGP